MHVAIHNYLGICWGKKQIFGGNCLRCYAYCKMIAAKIVVVRFFFGGGDKAQILESAASQASLGYLPVLFC